MTSHIFFDKFNGMKRGFSLVELSIVLVILGLLVGGVLSGQALIRAAELRSVTTEYGRYTSAVQSFRDKYFALPGDMNNATAFWGAAANCPGTSTQGSTDKSTCNGDGNGSVLTSAASREHFRFWQHLVNAGLIEGSYNGVPGSADSLCSTTANVPKSKLGTGLWFVYDYGAISGNGSVFDGIYNNSFELGAPSACQHPYNALVKPEEVWNIDTKIDDGKPATGKLVVRAVNGLNTCTDTATTSTLTASYLLSSSTISCGFIFRNPF